MSASATLLLIKIHCVSIEFACVSTIVKLMDFIKNHLIGIFLKFFNYNDVLSFTNLPNILVLSKSHSLISLGII